MSHEISVRKNGKAEMAYVGETPWHGLGQAVTKGASIGVWKKEAGLDWEALSSTVQYHNEDGLLLPMDSRKVIYRSDTYHPVGLVSDKYEIVQPSEVLEFFRELTESGDWHIHTAGALRGGSKIWAMASAEDVQGKVGKSDNIKGNLLLATSLDGSMKTTAMLTAVRVVCANTLRLALEASGADQVQISHRTWFNPDEVKESLGISVQAFASFMKIAQEMADTPIQLEESRNILRELFGAPKTSAIKPDAPDFAFQRLLASVSKTPEQTVKEQRSVDACLKLFAGAGMGSSLPTSQGTRWGLLNAITEHVDHDMGRTPDTRLESAWFGRGNEIKSSALDLLTV